MIGRILAVGLLLFMIVSAGVTTWDWLTGLGVSRYWAGLAAVVMFTAAALYSDRLLTRARGRR